MYTFTHVNKNADDSRDDNSSATFAPLRLSQSGLTAEARRAQSFFNLPAADEVDDLDAVAFAERDLRPLGAADDIAIQFDGETVGRERELFDETLKRRPLFNLFRLAVEFDPHVSSPLPCLDCSPPHFKPRRSSLLELVSAAQA
jgi:hypothetical protein